MSSLERKRKKLKDNFSEVETEVFRTDRHKRQEKKRRKKELSKFERHSVKEELRKLRKYK